MKKLLILPIALATSGAFALDFNPYISGKIGGGSAKVKTPGAESLGGGDLLLAGGVSSKVSEFVSLRGELELGGTYASLEKTLEVGSYKSTNKFEDSIGTYFVNVYADFLPAYKIKPYVGFGIGALNFERKNTEDEWTGGALTFSGSEKFESDFNFAYALNFGLGFNFTDNLMGDVGAHYVQSKLKDMKRNGVTVYGIGTPKYEMWMFNFGLRYQF